MQLFLEKGSNYWRKNEHIFLHCFLGKYVYKNKYNKQSKENPLITLLLNLTVCNKITLPLRREASTSTPPIHVLLNFRRWLLQRHWNFLKFRFYLFAIFLGNFMAIWHMEQSFQEFNINGRQPLEQLKQYGLILPCIILKNGQT